MKKIALLLVAIMLMSMVSIPSFAEETSYPRPYETKIVSVAANDTQASIEAHVKEIIEVDGLQFKDLNSNGSLDVYEDWRQDIDARVADLLSQMNLDEKIGCLFHATTGASFTSLYPYTDEFLWSNELTVVVDDVYYVPMYHSIITNNLTTYLHNVNGTPAEQLYENNIIQEIGESGRLGIPIVLSCDRSYNTFAGMVNMANYAFGVAHDEELLYELVSQYAKEERALGFHVPFHSYGVEIGSWYGDDVNYIATMTAAETRAYEENGVNACTKHFVARGGRSNYISAVSPANLNDSWLVGWQAAIDAGTSWIMLNNGSYLNDCYVAFDSESMAVLRKDLGYDGVVVSDWPLWMATPSSTGITPEGQDLSTVSVGEIYKILFEADVDQVGTFRVIKGTDTSEEHYLATYPNGNQYNYPDVVKQIVEDGTLSMENVDRHVTRVLKNKFELGLFEDPYGSMEEVLELVASDEYKAEQFELNTIEDIYAARNDKTNEMEIRLQTQSTVLLKNDNDLLPLAEGTKVFVTGSSEETTALDAAAIGTYATIVESMDEADVIVARVTAVDDNTEYIIEDANEAGKPIVLAIDGNGAVTVEPNALVVDNCDAILMMTYSAKADHGASMGNFFVNTLPSVFADMLYGVKEPSGSLVFEIARNSDDALMDWGELQLDSGVDMSTRLYMAATVRDNPTAVLPNNLGDVLYPNAFGMRYGQNADINLNTLVVDSVIGEVEKESWGNISLVSVAVDKTMKSGEAFPVYMIANNAGADGYVNVEVCEGDTVLASKFVSVEGGSFAVVAVDITLEGAGEHTITVGDMTKTIVVQ